MELRERRNWERDGASGEVELRGCGIPGGEEWNPRTKKLGGVRNWRGQWVNRRRAGTEGKEFPKGEEEV